MSTERTPQVGELLLLDGIMRKISAVHDNGAVEFTHPDPEQDEKEKADMAQWRERRSAWCAKVGDGFAKGEIRIEAMDGRLPTWDELDAAYRTVEAPPVMCRDGIIGVASLDWMDFGWGVRGRIDVKKYRTDAVVVAPAATIAASANAEGIATAAKAEG